MNRAAEPHTKVIAVANSKGGVGKTTMAMNLAGALANAGFSVRVIDGDPLGLARVWSGAGEQPFPAQVVTVARLDSSTLAQPGLDVAIIDCPNSRNLDFSRAAVAASDLALIPFRPSGPDIWATRVFIAALANDGTQTAMRLVENDIPRTKLASVLRRTADLHCETLKARLHHRKAFTESPQWGSSVDVTCDENHPAKLELLALMTEVCQLIDLRPAASAGE